MNVRPECGCDKGWWLYQHQLRGDMLSHHHHRKLHVLRERAVLMMTLLLFLRFAIVSANAAVLPAIINTEYASFNDIVPSTGTIVDVASIKSQPTSTGVFVMAVIGLVFEGKLTFNFPTAVTAHSFRVLIQDSKSKTTGPWPTTYIEVTGLLSPDSNIVVTGGVYDYTDNFMAFPSGVTLLNSAIHIRRGTYRAHYPTGGGDTTSLMSGTSLQIENVLLQLLIQENRMEVSDDMQSIGTWNWYIFNVNASRLDHANTVVTIRWNEVVMSSNLVVNGDLRMSLVKATSLSLDGRVPVLSNIITVSSLTVTGDLLLYIAHVDEADFITVNGALSTTDTKLDISDVIVKGYFRLHYAHVESILMNPAGTIEVSDNELVASRVQASYFYLFDGYSLTTPNPAVIYVVVNRIVLSKVEVAQNQWIWGRYTNAVGSGVTIRDNTASTCRNYLDGNMCMADRSGTYTCGSTGFNATPIWECSSTPTLSRPSTPTQTHPSTRTHTPTHPTTHTSSPPHTGTATPTPLLVERAIKTKTLTDDVDDGTSLGQQAGGNIDAAAQSTSRNTLIIVLCVVLGVVLMLAVIMVVLYRRRRRQQKEDEKQSPQELADTVATNHNSPATPAENNKAATTTTPSPDASDCRSGCTSVAASDDDADRGANNVVAGEEVMWTPPYHTIHTTTNEPSIDDHMDPFEGGMEDPPIASTTKPKETHGGEDIVVGGEGAGAFSLISEGGGGGTAAAALRGGSPAGGGGGRRPSSGPPPRRRSSVGFDHPTGEWTFTPSLDANSITMNIMSQSSLMKNARIRRQSEMCTPQSTWSHFAAINNHNSPHHHNTTNNDDNDNDDDNSHPDPSANSKHRL